MKNVLITYLSKTGITKKYAEEINTYLTEKGIKTALISIEEFDPKLVKEAEGILFGCWTHGLMIIFQHPDKPWVKFVNTLPDMKDKKIGMFIKKFRNTKFR